MAYNYQTQHDAVSFAKGRQGKRIDKIVIHWWGDPATNPSFGGVVNWFKNPSAGTSAHFVATGTGRQVAQMVNLNDTAYHAGDWNANLTSIGVELDPRCRPEDYDVAAELIADIRSAIGDVPLYWHHNFTSTRCPGNWDVVKLDRMSYDKYSHATEWGKGGDKTPVTPPKPVEPVIIVTKLDNPVDFTAKIDTPVLDVTTSKNTTTIKKGAGFRAYASMVYAGKMYYLTEYSYSKGIKAGVVSTDLELPVIEVPIPEPTPEIPTPEPEKPVEPNPTDPTEPHIFERFIEWLVKFIKGIWFK